MRQEEITELCNNLSAVFPKEELAPEKIEFLITYIANVTKTKEEAIQRLSGILKDDLDGISTGKTVLLVEHLRDRSTDHHDRLRFLEHRVVQLEHFRDKSADFPDRLRFVEHHVVQLENFRDKSADFPDRLRSLEHPKNSEDGKWTVVQGIFTAISFIASTIAILKAFGLLQIPWLK
ncbi:MAG: hypothetical protein WCI64_11605 [Chlorobium sp.]